MVSIDKAGILDVEAIYNLIRKSAKKDEMLPRSLQSIYENLRAFWVCRNAAGKVIGCCALQIVWKELAEVRSLVIDPRYKGKGLGRQLVEAALTEARELGIKKVFTLTYVPEFFKRLKFRPVDKKKLPHKIWSDCIVCPHFPDCHEEALMINI